MVPRILYLHPKTYKRLIRLRKQAERDGAYRVFFCQALPVY